VRRLTDFLASRLLAFCGHLRSAKHCESIHRSGKLDKRRSDSRFRSQMALRVRPQKVMNDLVAMEREAENVLQRRGSGRAALAQSPPTTHRSKLKFSSPIGGIIEPRSPIRSIIMFPLQACTIWTDILNGIEIAVLEIYARSASQPEPHRHLALGNNTKSDRRHQSKVRCKFHAPGCLGSWN
jgi:hypothetical protein